MVRAHFSFPCTFNEIVKACSSFYENNKSNMASESVLDRRAELADFVEKFHRDCGSLTCSVRNRIEDLRNGTCIFLMTAHQPNLFAYSGVFRKATLAFALAQELERTLNVPVVSFFGIVDQDFTDDKWVRTCHLPAVRRTGGILSLDIKLRQKVRLNAITKPTHDILKNWKDAIEEWLQDKILSIKRLSKFADISGLDYSLHSDTCQVNFEAFWGLVESCYQRAENYADFNAFLMSEIVNNVWRYDTLFSRFSDCQRAFAEEFSFLLSQSDRYSNLLRESLVVPDEGGVRSGVSDQEPDLAPFWYHCNCGSKAKLFLVKDKELLLGRGNCVGCGKHHDLSLGLKVEPTLSNIAANISARAIPMELIFFKGLMPSCYIGGIAGIEYLKQAEHVAVGLNIPFPTVVCWRPHDKYSGVGQIEASLELKRICKSLGVNDYSSARSLLESRTSETRRLIGNLEKSRQKILERSKANPNDFKLKEKLRKISIDQTKTIKALNLAVISNELHILENVSVVLDLIPSIIDYAINVGLEETSDQWMHFLAEKGDLLSEVNLV